MRTITIFKAVTKNWIRSRSGLFFSILFPVLLLLVFGAIFSNIGASGTTSIFIQNQDVTQPDSQPTALSTAYITALNDTGFFSIKTVPADANATDYARSTLGPLGGTIRILIINQGFQDNLTSRNRTSLTIMLDPSDQSAGIVRGVITNIGNALNYQLVGAENVIEYDETTVTTTRLSNVDYYVPGITAAFIMTNGIIALTATTTDFKRRGIIKRLAITPLKKIDWILGNVLSQTLLNFMLTGIMIAVGWMLFNVRIVPDAYAIALIFLGSVMFSGMGMLLSGLIKDVEAASAIGNAIAFPMMFLSGSYFPLDFTPSYIQAISKALPLTYFADGLRYAMLYKYPEGIFTNMAIVGVLAVTFIAVGSIVTRWKEK